MQERKPLPRDIRRFRRFAHVPRAHIRENPSETLKYLSVIELIASTES